MKSDFVAYELLNTGLGSPLMKPMSVMNVTANDIQRIINEFCTSHLLAAQAVLKTQFLYIYIHMEKKIVLAAFIK